MSHSPILRRASEGVDLARHVDALAPRVIVTLGREPSCARSAPTRPRIKKHMEGFYAGHAESRGIAFQKRAR